MKGGKNKTPQSGALPPRSFEPPWGAFRVTDEDILRFKSLLEEALGRPVVEEKEELRQMLYDGLEAIVAIRDVLRDSGQRAGTEPVAQNSNVEK